jgi:phosphoribosylglycinamide formyltransferase-1
MRVGVLVSGRGSNLGALIADAAQPGAPYRLMVVVSNRGSAPALERARAAGIPAVAVERKGFDSRAAQQREMVCVLRSHGVELVVTAGFDQILEPEVVAAFAGRVLNVHPSLLPAFAGTLHAQRTALEHGVKLTGCTVHLVTDEVDGGPIVLQAAVPVYDGDTEASLAARILIQEHRLLPQAVRLVACGRVKVDGRRVAIRA